MTTYQLKEEDGTFLTDPILSKDEWLSILHAADKDKRRSWLDVLKMFLYQPGHKAPCSLIGKEYSMDANAIKQRMVLFCQFAQKVSGKEFRVEDSDKPKESFWPIAMYGRYLKGDLFEWELRPELVSALQQFLLGKLLDAYRGPVLEEGLDNSRSKELYKWRLLAATAGRSTEEILGTMADRSSGMNFITWRTQDAIKGALEEHHKEIIDCFSILLSEDDFYEKYNKFVAFGKTFLSKTDAERILKEKEASVFLACYDPKENAVYKWTLYRDVCNYLGIDTKEGKPVEAYMSILQRIIERENQDTELIEKLKSETAPYFWSELLNAQDVLYQMQTFMQTSRPKNWLQHLYDEAIRTNHDVFSWWYPKYRDSVQLFLGMFENGKTAEDIPENTIDFYIRAQQNYICNNGQGCITKEEYPKIRQMWPQLYSILKRNVDSGEINPSDYAEMERMIRPSLNMNRPLANHRLWSALFPEKLTTCCKDADFVYAYETVRKLDSTLPPRTGRWLEDNLVFMDYLEKKVSYIEPWHRPLFARFLYDNLSAEEKNTDMEEYINLVKANKNLVLTGAPGTGKTYLARQIACQLILGKSDIDSLTNEEKAFFKEHYKLVQFHPSYDYTDFVEGLRPVERDQVQIGFKRQNGVIKQICEAAIINWEQSQKSGTEQKQEQDTKKLVLDLLNNAIGDNTEFQTKTGKLFNIAELEDNAFYVYAKEVGDRLIRVPLRDLYILIGKTRPTKVTDINDIIGRKRTQQYDSYLFSILDVFDKENAKTLAQANIVASEGPRINQENYVLIIDEINRGELSKIFGEVFFAIDPGYRGPDGKVQTQYQNLIEEDDIFYDGFYVPDNVYIIGTMNDIDRGVESMDFAIRRRFAWKEVKASSRVSMLEAKIPDFCDEAKARMNSLNAALKKPEIGLTDAYDIGPAYFLKLDRYEGDNRFDSLWEYHIKGVLQEYLRGARDIEGKLSILKDAYDHPEE